MSSDEEDLLLASAGFLILQSLTTKKKKRRQPRRWWVKTLFKNRYLYSGSHLLDDIQGEDGEHFRSFCRMTPGIFNTLLFLVKPKIEKQDTNFRCAIPARERLALTLHFLATGNSYSSLAFTFKISKQSISSIIPEVCLAIIENLQDYVKVCIILQIVIVI